MTRDEWHRSLRDGFVGGGLRGRSGVVEGGLAALGALDALGGLVHGGVLRD